MEILALVLAIIAFILCFIVWFIPFVGPLLVIGLSIFAIVISIIVLVNISEQNKSNVLENDFKPKSNTKPLISAIVSGVSLVIAVLFLLLHIFLAINLDSFSDSPSETNFHDEDNRVTQAEYGVAYEIEDHIFLTIESAIFEEETLSIEYSITNDSGSESAIYLSNFYYNSNVNIDEKIYPYKNTMMPIYIEPNAIYVSEIITIHMDEEPTSIGYDSVSGESIVFDVQ